METFSQSESCSWASLQESGSRGQTVKVIWKKQTVEPNHVMSSICIVLPLGTRRRREKFNYLYFFILFIYVNLLIAFKEQISFWGSILFFITFLSQFNLLVCSLLLLQGSIKIIISHCLTQTHTQVCVFIIQHTTLLGNVGENYLCVTHSELICRYVGDRPVCVGVCMCKVSHEKNTQAHTHIDTGTHTHTFKVMRTASVTSPQTPDVKHTNWAVMFNFGHMTHVYLKSRVFWISVSSHLCCWPPLANAMSGQPQMGGYLWVLES